MRRRLLRSGMWMMAVLGVLIAGLLVTAWVGQGYISRGGVTAGLAHGRLEVAWGGGKVTRDPLGWSVSNAQGFAAALMPVGSAWRPSVVHSGLGSVPGGPGPLFEITAVYVPLWTWVIVAGGMTGLLWRRAGHAIVPGHCACGYDLRGLASGRCPECGRGAPGVLFRMVAGLFAAAGRAMRQARWADRPVPVRV